MLLYFQGMDNVNFTAHHYVLGVGFNSDVLLCSRFIGFVVTVFEAPCCCQFIDFADKVGKFSENRPYWQKAVTYCV